MKNVIVLGAGMVGRAIAIDLSKDYRVCSADINENKLKMLSDFDIKTIKADMRDKNNLIKLIEEFDLVVEAVPGFMGFETLKSIISAGKNVVDISFFPEDAFELDELARQNNVIAVVDCGVAPGMSNLILGYHNKRMKVDSFEFMVGGLPFEREMPFQYKAPFSPIDVLEEYTRPARFVEDGKIVVKPPLSEPEYVHFKGIGTLEAFNTDGLRTLIKTMNIPNMKEKTLRYPGHIHYIQFLKDTGFFGQEPIKCGSVNIKPIDLTASLLFDRWKLQPDDDEFTVMRIIITGVENSQRKQYVYNLFDRYDKSTCTSSMARTTGYTATSVANLILNAQFKRIGISAPEYVGEDEALFNEVLDYQSQRGIVYEMEEIHFV